MTTKKEKLKALENAAESLEKTHGEGSIMRVGSRKIVPIDVIPTQIFELDHYVIGAGGFPRGRIIEVYGPESGGKTTLALQVVANVQHAGGTAAYVDAEHALDLNYAQALGVDKDDLFISQPDFGEQALEIADGLIETGMVDIVVVDSVAALIPKAELEGEMSDQFMGLQARLMGKAMRKLAGKVRRTGTCLVFINQIREKIGVTFGSPETSPGGRALKFAASLRLDVRRIAQVKDGETLVGAKTKFKASKNKIAAPLRECEVDLLYGTGFDKAGSLVAAGLKYGVVEKSGSWYSVFGDRIGQGALNAAQTVRSNAELFTKISAAILKIKEEETKK